METTHIRITEELKEELDECDGQNFTEKVRNYCFTGEQKDVNRNVNSSEELQEIKKLVEDVNRKLTDVEPLTKKEVDNIISRYV